MIDGEIKMVVIDESGRKSVLSNVESLQNRTNALKDILNKDEEKALKTIENLYTEYGKVYSLKKED